MQPDLAQLFSRMARMRHFELAIARLWRDGVISGELHLGVGEEAIVAGVVAHLVDGDALALDYRSTPPLVARGVDLKALALELMGHEEGLCRGRGGHMHLLVPECLAASSGIVGASGPLACGFALSAQHLRPGRVAVAFFGEGAMNQGMLMESLNLAVVWRLPVVFVCKDSRFAITTRSSTVTGGSLLRRARSFGLPAARVGGARADAVWRVAGKAVARARRGKGPSFILARCHHPEGHFLGDPLLRVFQDPVGQTRTVLGPLAGAAIASPGAPWSSRLGGLWKIGRVLISLALERYLLTRDPVRHARGRLRDEVTRRLDANAQAEVAAAISAALGIARRDANG